MKLTSPFSKQDDPTTVLPTAGGPAGRTLAPAPPTASGPAGQTLAPAPPTDSGPAGRTLAPAPPPAPVPADPRPAPVPADPPAAVHEPDGSNASPAFAGQVVGQVLPIYFVGDESHSMRGDPIDAVNAGLVDLRDEVAKHPLIGKKVRFGIITFADTAETRLELSELSEDLVLPTLSTRGRGTSYASAFEALRHTLPADIALLKVSGFQVHRPAVFFLSDGQPTEKESKWQERLSQLSDPGFNERPNILAFGVGDADPQVIQQLASSPSHAFMMREGVSTAGAIAEFAASMLNSMVSSAERLDRGEQSIEFEKPEGFVQLDAPLL